MDSNGKLTEQEARENYAQYGFDYDLHEKLVKILANAWINLDATELLNYIHPEFQYDSQWVFATMFADEYPEYITKKFENIKKTGAIPAVEIVPENGIPDTFGGTMIHLDQQGNHAYLRIKCKEDKIFKMDMCMF